MIAQWLLYAVELTVVVGVLALAGEYILRLYGRSARWLWATSLIVGFLVVPLAWWALPAPVAAAADPSLAIGTPTLATTAMAAPVAPAPSLGQRVAARVLTVERRIDGTLPLVCLAASLLAALALAIGYLRLLRQRASWRERVVDGVPVLVSEGTGPAVVGLRRSRIVVPLWVLEEPEARRRMILAHELEHVAAGDPRLLFGALAAVVAAPWNPAVWWQLRRLRLAAEVDCDARVVSRGEDLRGYAGLLLDVGMRFGEGGVLAAFAEPRSLLGRRLRALTAPLPPRRGWRVAAAGAAAAAVTLAASIAPRPVRPAPAPARQAAVAQTARDMAGRPTSAAAQSAAAPAPLGAPRMVVDTPPPAARDTVYDVAPELTNREAVRTLLIASYPPELKKAGLGGRTDVWIDLNADGSVAGTKVKQSSGRPELDAAAAKIAAQMTFTAAQKRGKPVATRITVPIVFRTSADNTPPPPPPPPAGAVPDPTAGPAVAPPVMPTREQLRQGPMFTPYDVAPNLLNRDEVRAALISAYPPELKAAGVGGTTMIWELLDETGAVDRVLVKKGSGQPAIDSAAVSVGRVMRFSPGRLKGQARSVWIMLPIIFRSTPGAAAPADTGAKR